MNPILLSLYRYGAVVLVHELWCSVNKSSARINNPHCCLFPLLSAPVDLIFSLSPMRQSCRSCWLWDARFLTDMACLRLQTFNIETKACSGQMSSSSRSGGIESSLSALHGLHLLLIRLCWLLAPPHSLHSLLIRRCWQMLPPL